VDYPERREDKISLRKRDRSAPVEQRSLFIARLRAPTKRHAAF